MLWKLSSIVNSNFYKNIRWISLITEEEQQSVSEFEYVCKAGVNDVFLVTFSKDFGMCSNYHVVSGRQTGVVPGRSSWIIEIPFV